MLNTMKCGLAMAKAAQKLGGGRNLDYKELAKIIAKLERENPQAGVEYLAMEALTRWERR